ncbi:hypothetical protein [Bacteroides congonensis]
MKILTKLYFLLIAPIAFTGCEAGLEYEEVPENVYNNVELGTNMCNIYSRQFFNNQIYAKNWDRWVEEYVAQATIGNYQSEKDYTNNTSTSLTILGQTIAPGGTVKVKNTLTTEDDSSAPDGKVYVINAFADKYAIYSHYTSGSYLFDASKFTGDFKLVDKDGNPLDASVTQSGYIKMPVDIKQLVVAIVMSDTNGGFQIDPVGDAPTLGVPNDFSQPRRYLVTNIARRPDGKPAAQRLYEIRIQLLP